MAGTNEMGSVEGQLVGLPLAGPETFTVQQLAYLKRALGVDETLLWSGTATNADTTLAETANNFERIKIYYKSGQSVYNSVEVLVSGSNQKIFMCAGNNTTSNQYLKFGYCVLDGTSLTKGSTQSVMHYREGSGTGNAQAAYESFTFLWDKVVGIHRIAGGN